MNSTLRIAKALSLTVLSALILAVLFLPYICNTFIIPRLVEDLPFARKEIEITTISPWRISGSINLTTDQQTAAAIPRFDLRFSPARLLQGEIESITLDAPFISLEKTNTGISLKGLPAAEKQEDSKDMPPVIEIPVAVRDIVVKRGRLHLRTGAKEYSLDIKSQIHLGFSNGTTSRYQLATFSTSLETAGDLRTTLQAQGVFSAAGLLISVESSIPSLKNIAAIAPGAKNVSLGGALALKSRIALSPQMQLAHLDAETAITGFEGTTNQVTLSGSESGSTMEIHLTGDSKTLNYTLAGLRLTAPEKVDIDASGSYAPASGLFDTETTFYTEKINHALKVKATGKRGGEGITADVLVQSEPFSLEDKTTIGKLETRGKFSFADGVLNANLQGSLGSIKIPEKDFAVDGIRWTLPIYYPAVGKHQRGVISLQQIRYKGENLAQLRNEIDLTETGVSFTSDLNSTGKAGARMQCSGQALFKGNIRANCTFAETEITPASLPGFITLPEKTDFSLRLSADADISYADGTPDIKAQVKVKDGSFTSGETSVTGLSTTVTFPDLPTLRTKTGQKLTIGEITSGKIHMENGNIFYTIENDDTVFLEKVQLNWCGGKVETAGLRLKSGMKEVDTTLYCDRLGFAELLRQFGVEDTEGEGSLNGRLPVSLTPEGIRFDDGFLFSTPGNSGIVHFRNTQQLRQGMGATGQSATLDYSIKALEDFSYNWTKLSFNTEGENLLLALQLDGKPASPLPFGYKNGQIVATEKGPGLQHPIRLDMNFRLPLQQLFKYGKSIQSLMEKM